MAETRDMTTGAPAPMLIRFSIPVLLGSSMDAIYSITNGAILGQFVNINAFTAFGVSFYIYWMVWCVQAGMISGFTYVFAKRFGEGDSHAFGAAAAMSLWVVLAFGGCLAAAGVLGVYRLLILMNTPPQILDYERIYLQIRFAAMPIAFLGGTANAVFYAAGNSRTPFVSSVISIVINIILSVFFVLRTPLGITGVALAAAIAQTAACVFSLVKLRGAGILHIKKRDLKPDFGVIRPLISIGLPLGVRDLPSAVVALLVQQAVNNFGMAYAAGIAAGKQMNNFLFLLGTAVSNAALVYVGQNFGAKKYDRVARGVRIALIMSLICVVITVAATAPFRLQIISLFIPGGGTAADAFAYGVRQFGLILLIVPAYYFTLLFRAVFNGLGNGFWPMVSGFVEAGVRVAVVFVLVPLTGQWGLYIAEPAGWPIMAALLMIVYFWGFRKKIHD